MKAKLPRGLVLPGRHPQGFRAGRELSQVPASLLLNSGVCWTMEKEASAMGKAKEPPL